MNREQSPTPLDGIPLISKCILLPDGSITDCYQSGTTGEWYYLTPKKDELGQPVIEEDVEVLEKIPLA